MKYRFKINGVVSSAEFNRLSFGRQLQQWPRIKEFMRVAKLGDLRQKRTSTRKALKEFLELHSATEYFFIDRTSANYRDDVVTIWYR